MFKNPFSFEGRIRRTEYGISFIIYALCISFINIIITETNGEAVILLVVYIPLLWFLWAQSAKRCHDVGNSGWWQLIPFYALWLIFQEGDHGENQYGKNPKESSNSTNYPSTYQGGYSGGHNSPDSTYQGGYSGGHNNSNSGYGSSNNNINQRGEYREGDLYK